jgi:eukaryotic-like serine/threonine-protein kinase
VAAEHGTPSPLPPASRDTTMSGTICPHCGDVHEPEPGACHRPPLEGRTLPDGLRVLQAVGPVKLGALYRAQDSSSHVEVDLLLLHHGVIAQLRPQFFRAARIKHPNVAGVRALGQTPEGVCYVALELFPGELLSEMLQPWQILPLAEAADLVLQAAAGLQEVHRVGLLHGNLSPETILVTRTADDRPLVKLVRLGWMQFGTKPSAGGDAGTRYAAPERLAGHPLDKRSDVFSLGAVLHRLLTRAPPTAVLGTSEPVSDAAWPVISKALDPLPERRFPTVAAFAEALAGITRGTQTWGRRPKARPDVPAPPE